MSEFTGRTFRFAALGLTLILSPLGEARLVAASTQEEKLQMLGELVASGDARLIQDVGQSMAGSDRSQEFDKDFERAFEKGFDKDIPALD